MTLRRQIVQWQLLTWLVFLIVTAILTLVSSQRTALQSAQEASRTELNQLQTLLTDAVDAETGLRGYIITGDEVFLEPYTRGRDRFQADVDMQLALISQNPTSDSAVQQLQVRNTQTNMQRWFTEVAALEIAARQMNAPPSLVRQQLGRTLIDAARLNIERYRMSEQALLERRGAEAAEISQRLGWIFLAALLGAIAISVVTSVFLSNRLARDVGRLVGSAERAANGDLSGRVGASSTRELSRLASAFNTMTENLQTSRDDLNARNAALSEQARAREQSETTERSLSEVLRLFTASYNRDEIFRQLLDLLTGRHGFPVGVMYTYDEWQGAFIAAATHGTAGDLRRDIPLDEGLVGQAVRDRKILTVPDNLMLTVETGLSHGPARFTSILPVFYQDRIMGVLVLGSQSEPEAATLNFLDRLGRQVGIALQNLDQYTNLQALSRQLQVRQQEIEEKNHDLERADKMKSEFLANMSHELRTPLNAILGFSELLQEQFYGPLNADQSEYLLNISGSGEHLLSLINDILDLSKIEAGRMELDVEEIDLPALLNGSIAIVRDRAHTQNLRLVVDTNDAPPLHADPRKVKQIVFNLLSNAVKFTPTGGTVTLATRRTDRPNEGPGVEIAVTDTGIGISPEDQKKLFREFTQVDGSLARRHEGTGLGLALTKRLVELHSGRIAVRSSPGAGSTFTVWLPTIPKAVPALPVPPDARPPLATLPATLPTTAPASASSLATLLPTTTPTNGINPLVLIVEDDDSTATLINAYLEGAGYSTARVRNGVEGLEQARALRPHVITLDVMMPEMDGWQFLQEAAQDDVLRAIPVVVLSMASDLKFGWSLGAAAVLSKPVRREELFRALTDLGIAPRPDAPASILVVDDDPRAVQVVGDYLRSLGHSVVAAVSGVQGIELAEQASPDIIVLDLMMPEVDGFMVVDRLRENPQTQSIPVIILTAKIVTPEERARLNGYISAIAEKSDLNRTTFLAEVNRAVRHQQAVGNRHPAVGSGTM